MSISSVRDYKNLRKNLTCSYETIYFTNHAIRPLSLFTGISQRVSIVISCGMGNLNKNLFTTFYLRTKNPKNLLQTFTYCKTSCDKERDNLVPKIGNINGTSIWRKQDLKKTNILSGLGKRDSTLYYKDYGETYWVFPFNFPPYLTPLKSFKELKIDNKYLNCIFCVFNSSVHYIFYSEISDCWHFGSWHLNEFPIDLMNLPPIVDELSNELKKSFKKNRITRFDKRANGDIYEYKVAKSKPIIDQIDTILAQHYGFTEEELDFIINYDIKYRMGKELDAYIEGALGKENINTRE